MKRPLIVIAGPTACGKTAVSIALAKRIDGEIVSADSMQVYKHMDIGTAKPDIAERDGVRHHMIDVLYPNEPFSVAVFRQMAQACLEEVYAKGKTPILVGGTGFYMNALIRGNDFSEDDNDFQYRRELYALAAQNGNGFVHEMLRRADPVSAEKIHENNVKRVVRALEYLKLTGEPISVHNMREKAREGAYDARLFLLYRPRERLYQGIDARVDDMIARGLVREVKKLLDMGYDAHLTSMQGLGYKELVPVVKGDVPLDEAVRVLKRDTRRFAKRQLTWFKHQCEGHWMNVDECDIEVILENMMMPKRVYGE